MKLSFMTLGCPQWNLETVCRKGREFGFDGVDFRGVDEGLDITVLPAFTSGIAQSRRILDEAGLEVSGISSSITVCDPQKREACIEEARRTIAVAHGLSCVNVRVFGGGPVETEGRAEAARYGRECIEQILALDGARDVRWLFETHDYWVKGADCRLLLDEIQEPSFGALWDMGHTFRVGGERPADTWKAIGPRVRYTHVKDAVHEPTNPASMADGWRYVFPGAGTLPLAESIGILRENGYDGWLVFEHEKRWHPELAEPEQIFPAFVAWAGSIYGYNRTRSA